MEQLIKEYAGFFIGIFFLVVGLTFLFFTVKSMDEHRSQLNDKITSKVNITENKYIYDKKEFKDTRTMASVLSEIKQADLDIKIFIVNTEITSEMRTKYRNENDAEEIQSFLNVDYIYSKEYFVDTEGNVSKVIYRPAF